MHSKKLLLHTYKYRKNTHIYIYILTNNQNKKSRKKWKEKKTKTNANNVDTEKHSNKNKKVNKLVLRCEESERKIAYVIRATKGEKEKNKFLYLRIVTQNISAVVSPSRSLIYDGS